jgi:hypothetical protein
MKPPLHLSCLGMKFLLPAVYALMSVFAEVANYARNH